MIGTKDELIKFLLFVPCDGGIEVSIISDVDITEDLSPEFAEEITTLLEEEE